MAEKAGGNQFRCELSIVATVFNEQETISEFVRTVVSHLLPLQVSYELILVNDGSRDASEKILEDTCRSNPQVKAITLSRNFGQQIAASAGLQYAGGRFAVIMDGDLQNPPSEIPALYRKIKEGYDIVYTRSSVRNNFWDEATSRFFWFCLNSLLGLKMVSNQLMMKIMTAQFVSHFKEYPESTRVVAGITHDIGMRYAVLEVENQKRRGGKGHYSLLSRLGLSLDIILALSHKPLTFLIYLGGAASILFLFLGCTYLIKHFIYDVPAGYTSIVLLICLFGSLNIAMLGLIGRYLSNIYLEVKRRPLFFVQRTINL